MPTFLKIIAKNSTCQNINNKIFNATLISAYTQSDDQWECNHMTYDSIMTIPTTKLKLSWRFILFLYSIRAIAFYWFDYLSFSFTNITYQDRKQCPKCIWIFNARLHAGTYMQHKMLMAPEWFLVLGLRVRHLVHSPYARRCLVV